jgi:hypothetical protein
MNTHARSIQRWRAVHRRLGSTSDTLTIPKAVNFPHPRDAGANLTATWPVGQMADYLLAFEVGAAPLLIREFSDRYEAFIGGVQLTAQIIRLVEANPRAAMFIGGALLGGLIGTAITSKREGAIVGAGLGLLVAALVSANRDKRPPA